MLHPLRITECSGTRAASPEPHRALSVRRCRHASCSPRATMIAYDKHGQVFALIEGPELLLHDGDSEGPLWRKTLDAPIVGLGITSDKVVGSG